MKLTYEELELRLSDALQQLDVQSSRSEALAAKLNDVCAENAALKSRAAYFSYGSEHQFEWHKTADEAVEAAEAAIDDYRGDACDGWSEEVDSICWGVIMQTSTKVGERPRSDDDCCDPSIDTVCDYALLPDIKTPNTDAWVNEQRAAGADLTKQQIEAAMKSCYQDEQIGLIEAAEIAGSFAAQLRGSQV